MKRHFLRGGSAAGHTHSRRKITEAHYFVSAGEIYPLWLHTEPSLGSNGSTRPGFLHRLGAIDFICIFATSRIYSVYPH